MKHDSKDCRKAEFAFSWSAGSFENIITNVFLQTVM
jgi:hypothetical protein